MPNHFLASEELLRGKPAGLVKATQRLLLHSGFDDVRIVDGANDQGADLIAGFRDEKWVIQVKWTQNKYIDETGVKDCDRAITYYKADKALLVTNAQLSPTAHKRRLELRSLGIQISVWDGGDLESIFQAKLPTWSKNERTLRPYQQAAHDACIQDLQVKDQALLVLATGLGKTAVASSIIKTSILNGAKKILVLAHLKELVEQLEVAIWPSLPKSFQSRTLNGDSSTAFDEDGLIVSTIDSAAKLINIGYEPDLIVIDEAHHTGASGMYSDLLSHYSQTKILGLTATPWRGDKYDIQAAFGEASFSMGIAEGMAQGWLSQVDYRIFTDNIDWNFVKQASRHKYSIKELNKKLFLPGRDEKIVEELREIWRNQNKPQAVIFCATIEHADRIAHLLSISEPSWSRAQSLHSSLAKRERSVILNNFRLRRIPIITCVDVFNEGVDVPDVSILAFLRVTHSRRIFVQQLGRGLRLSPGKEALTVLDFVTDIRRISATSDLKTQISVEHEILQTKNDSRIHFEDETAGKLMDYWLKDAADLDTAADDVILNFPEARGYFPDDD